MVSYIRSPEISSAWSKTPLSQLCGQASRRLLGEYCIGGAVLLQTSHRDVDAHILGTPLRQLLETVGILDRDLAGATHHDRLEVLTPHNGTGTGPPRSAGGEGDRTRELHQILASAADGHSLQLAVTKLGHHGVLEHARTHAP